MKRALLAAAVVLLLPLYADAQVRDFYHSMLDRGVRDSEAGSYAAAVTRLHIAAFGLLDDVENYEVAEVYLAVSAAALGDDAEVTRAVQRVVTAELVSPKYATLSLPAAVRTKFESLAAKALPPEKLGTLKGAKSGS